MIKRYGAKFYVEVYNPKPTLKYCGQIITDKKGIHFFCTHIKKPDKHFYIKSQGYPINKSLLEKLEKIKIRYIIIPEDGKTGFKVYIVKTSRYLKGAYISEPLTEPQLVIPLRELDTINIPRELIPLK